MCQNRTVKKDTRSYNGQIPSPSVIHSEGNKKVPIVGIKGVSEVLDSSSDVEILLQQNIDQKKDFMCSKKYLQHPCNFLQELLHTCLW